MRSARWASVTSPCPFENGLLFLAIAGWAWRPRRFALYFKPQLSQCDLRLLPLFVSFGLVPSSLDLRLQPFFISLGLGLSSLSFLYCCDAGWIT
jgi:hypothetical protein